MIELSWAQMGLFILASVVLGISVGQILGMRSMNPIIDSYKRTIEGYKKTLQMERDVRDEIVDGYKELIDLLTRSK